MTDQLPDPGDAVPALAASRTPLLIGVRHHSAALAAAIPALLTDFGPDALLIELPAEAQDWIEWLGSPDTIAPLAFAGAGPDGYLAFYPFADFSPELAAIRWARTHGVPVVCADAAMGSSLVDKMHDGEPLAPAFPTVAGTSTAYLASLGRKAAEAELWDTLVEAAAAGRSAEELRVAGLGIGWAHRQDEVNGPGLNSHDAYREHIMRTVLHATLATHPKVAAVVGSFHAAALLEPLCPQQFGVATPSGLASEKIVVSLVPYEFGQLDSRSGYPSGVKDPAWQQGVFESRLDASHLREHAIRALTKVARHLRDARHPTGPGEIREATRLAMDLASLRGNAAPDRREILEALQSVYAQGDVLGKGRAVARAAQEVLVGNRRGCIDPRAPRSGLSVNVELAMATAKLPFGPALMPASKTFDLDPLRETTTAKPTLDWERQLILSRLNAAGIQYGTTADVAGIGGAALTHRWKVQFTSATLATLEMAGVRGVTLEQAASGAMFSALARQLAAGEPTVPDILIGLTQAADAALFAPFGHYLTLAEGTLLRSASLQELLAAHELLAKLSSRHFAVFDETPWQPRVTELSKQVLATAIAQVEGLRGSELREDATSLSQLFAQLSKPPLRLMATLRSFTRDASALIQGAAWGVLATVEDSSAEDFSAQLSGWVYGANSAEQRAALQGRLAGFSLTGGALLESGNAVLAGLIELVEALSDQDFLARVPALRGGFDALSPADRQRTLDGVRNHTGAAPEQVLVDPAVLLAWSKADQRAWEALEASGLRHGIAPITRWRLLLGREHEALSVQERRYARSLDEMYGHGRGEGAQADRAGRIGGTDDAYPSARVWSQELAELFGAEIRQEVLADSMGRGRTDVLGELATDAVVPSVELLSNILNLAGALPEAHLGTARALIKRIVAELSRELANELRPTLHGIAGVRATRRKTPRIDLTATILANLATARPRNAPETGWQLVPTAPLFKTLSNKSSSWDVVVLVDVSGSMEASTVFAALTAAILASAPALRVHFIAFSTEIVDLSEHVADPLALLLEVSVGGGTNIAKALSYARTLVSSPQRTLLAVVSDFDEGGSLAQLLNETANLAASGVHLFGCAALDRSGTAGYNASVAAQLVAAGMPIAAVTPQGLTAWVAEVIKRHG